MKITLTKSHCPFCGKRARITKGRPSGGYCVLNHHCDNETTITIRISGRTREIVEERWERRTA